MNFKVIFFVSLKIAIVIEPVVHSGSMNTLTILLILICKHGKFFMCILQYILSMTSRFQWMDTFNLCVLFIHKYLIFFDIMANVVLFPLSTPCFPFPLKFMTSKRCLHLCIYGHYIHHLWFQKNRPV